MQTRMIRSSERGAALAAAMSLILTISMVALSFLSVTMDATEQASQQEDLFRLRSAAESATTIAVHDLWSGFLASGGGTAGSLTAFRGYLDGQGIAAPTLIVDPLTGQTTVPTGSQAPAPVDLRTQANLPTKVGRQRMAGVVVDELSVTRSDDGTSTSLVFRTTVSRRFGSGLLSTRLDETIEQSFVVEGSPWQGLQYALLANNVNCVMCHAAIDSVDRFYNIDPSLYGTYDRVRVGTMEELRLRSSADSTVAGTLYTRGRAIDKGGSPIVDWSIQTLKGFQFDAAGKIVEDSWGAPTSVDLVPADPVTPAPLENLYIDYNKDESLMVDGYLPVGFPPPFPDDGGLDPATGQPTPGAAGNRRVDPSEYDAVAGTATGSLTGGHINISAPGNVISTNGQLTSALSAANAASLGSDTSGNVILIGTDSQPLVINGLVAIEGDLVIQGVVKGEGALLVSGNVFIPSDLTYQDGTDAWGARTYGLAQDGVKNSLAIASGGSIVLGDLWYQKQKIDKKTGKPKVKPAVTGYDTGGFNFVLSELAIFNRNEWTNTQPVLPGNGEDINDSSTWTAVNSSYDPTYVPRYYAFTEGGTVPFFTNKNYFDSAAGTWVGKEHGGKWTDGFTADPTDTSDPVLYDGSGNPIAEVKGLTGQAGWIDDDMLHQLMTQADAARTVGAPFEIDGLLYSNNSIFGIVGSTSSAQGRMIANGGIVAADIGLLVPGNGGVGLNLNYDTRPKSLLQLKSDEGITLRRSLWVSQ